MMDNNTELSGFESKIVKDIERKGFSLVHENVLDSFHFHAPTLLTTLRKVKGLERVDCIYYEVTGVFSFEQPQRGLRAKAY